MLDKYDIYEMHRRLIRVGFLLENKLVYPKVSQI